MSTIKKAFQPILSLLEANPSAKVRDLLEQVKELASAKTGASGSNPTTFHKTEDGIVVGIKCYYHGKWMHPEIGTFGKKANSASGFNTMCKDGLSKWTKQQRDYKQGKDAVLSRLQAGEQLDLTAELAALEAAKTAIVPREDSYGFDTLEELLADNAARGL